MSQNAITTFKFKESDILMVATVDGKVYGLDKNSGAVIWSWPSLGSGISSKFTRPLKHGKENEPIPYFIIEPNRGAIYVAEPNLPIKRLPISIRQLADHSPHHSAEGTIYVAEKSTEIILFNPLNGYIKYRLKPDSDLLKVFDKDDRRLASIGRISYNISVFNTFNPDFPKWTITYSELRLPSANNFRKADPFLSYEFMPGIDGSLVCLKNNALLWTNKFISPAISLFGITEKDSKLFPGGFSLNNIEFTSSHSEDENSYVHISVHEETPFLLESSTYSLPNEILHSPLYENVQQCPASCFPGSPDFPECLSFSSELIVETSSNLLSGPIPTTSTLLLDPPRSTLVIDPPNPVSQSNYYNSYMILGLFFVLFLSLYFFKGFLANKKEPVPETKPLRSRRKNSDRLETESDYLKVQNDQIIGYGSHGTVVFQGTFQGRPVAVKRLLINFYEVADREVALLLKSDSHPNVVRYFCKKQSRQFLYIALELCLCSIYDIVESAATSLVINTAEIRDKLDFKTISSDILNGLAHLHSLSIVHRDIKPQNVLISKKGPTEFKALITDFGLCKKLTEGQNSFYHSTEERGGTTGWRAPEMLGFNSETRLTKQIDIFSTGLVLYYILSSGQHPFGDLYSRDKNIFEGNYDLYSLSSLDSVASDLIEKMIAFEPDKRISCETALSHPFFWNSLKKITFLQDLSDRLDVEDRQSSVLLNELELLGPKIFGLGWHHKVDKSLYENLGKYRKYRSESVQDLLRAIRNKKNHYQDLPKQLKIVFGSMPEGFLHYFSQKFPSLFIYLYNFGRINSLNKETVFRSYY